MLDPPPLGVAVDPATGNVFVVSGQEGDDTNFETTVFVVGQQSISFTSTPPVGAAYSGSNNQNYQPVTAVSSAGLGVTLSIDSSSTSGCQLTDNGNVVTSAPSPATVSYAAPTGTCVIDANQAGSGDYQAAPQVSQSFTVQPAPLTITASSVTIAYGTVPDITASYSGFAGGDTAKSLNPGPTCTTTATSTSPPGTYPSTCSGAADPDYTITYVQGTVTVVGGAPAFVLHTPPTTTASEQAYGYTFAASGWPAVTYSLASGAPTWLSIDPASGMISGTPPSGTLAFTYSVIATNALGTATAGSFRVIVLPLGVSVADVSVAMSCHNSWPITTEATCTLMAHNAGSATAEPVTAAILLPPLLGIATCSTGCVQSSNGLAVTWPLGNLASGATSSVGITFASDTAGSFQVDAVADAQTLDTNQANNSTSQTVSMEGSL